MNPFKRIVDFYIESSLHVALSTFALVQVTLLRFGLPFHAEVSVFAFCGTVVGYNFVKYDALARNPKFRIGGRLKAIIALSVLCFAAAAVVFLRFRLVTQITAVAVFMVTALYTLPFFPNRRNARNWAGLKIYFVSISWVGVTVALPALEYGLALSPDLWITAVQRFILIVVLLFIFEIIDLAWDDPHLLTVPQQIGVRNTKIVGCSLMLVLLLLDLVKRHHDFGMWCVNLVFAVVVGLFLLFASERSSRYYSVFWAESLPVLWWVALWLLR